MGLMTLLFKVRENTRRRLHVLRDDCQMIWYIWAYWGVGNSES